MAALIDRWDIERSWTFRVARIKLSLRVRALKVAFVESFGLTVRNPLAW